MKTYLLSFFILALALGTARAKSNDPDENKWKITTVEWINQNLDNDHRDVDYKWVVLIGKLTEQVDEDTYILDDGTGTMTLDVFNDEALPVGERVVVRGHIDDAVWDIGEPELNVESWRLERKKN